MKVEDKRENQMVSFYELSVGDFFEYEVVCIKIGSTLGFNTYTNDTEKFDTRCRVKKLNAKIVIE